eukprot:Awhi_evm1s4226
MLLASGPILQPVLTTSLPLKPSTVTRENTQGVKINQANEEKEENGKVEKFLSSLRAEDELSVNFSNETLKLRSLLETYKLRIFGPKELQKWEQLEQQITVLSKVIGYLIDYNYFVSIDFQTQFEMVKELTEREGSLQPPQLQSNHTSQKNKKIELSYALASYKNHLIVAEKRGKEDRIKFLTKTILEIKEELLQCESVAGKHVLSKFLSQRTELLQGVKEFLPEKLMDKEFLKAVGMELLDQKVLKSTVWGLVSRNKGIGEKAANEGYEKGEKLVQDSEKELALDGEDKKSITSKKTYLGLGKVAGLFSRSHRQ